MPATSARAEEALRGLLRGDDGGSLAALVERGELVGRARATGSELLDGETIAALELLLTRGIES